MQIAYIVIAAVILDRWIGEPDRWHPLVFFGRCATYVEQYFWHEQVGQTRGRLLGCISLIVMLTGVGLLFFPLQTLLSGIPNGDFLFSTLVVYGCIAARSLREHAEAVMTPLNNDDIDTARQKLSLIVSRDTHGLPREAIAAATCETVLENGSDGVFSAIFWFVLAGVPGVLIYRAVNTLDAMWGYKNERYLHFGWAAAKLDDVLNWVPARLVALSYALMGHFQCAMHCWSEQASYWKSPNAGAVMAAGAGSLHIQLGGEAVYHGALESRPLLGDGKPAQVEDIQRTLDLINRTLIFWLAIIVVING